MARKNGLVDSSSLLNNNHNSGVKSADFRYFGIFNQFCGVLEEAALILKKKTYMQLKKCVESVKNEISA